MVVSGLSGGLKSRKWFLETRPDKVMSCGLIELKSDSDWTIH